MLNQELNDLHKSLHAACQIRCCLCKAIAVHGYWILDNVYSLTRLCAKISTIDSLSKLYWLAPTQLWHVSALLRKVAIATQFRDSGLLFFSSSPYWSYLRGKWCAYQHKPNNDYHIKTLKGKGPSLIHCSKWCLSNLKSRGTLPMTSFTYPNSSQLLKANVSTYNVNFRETTVLLRVKIYIFHFNLSCFIARLVTYVYILPGPYGFLLWTRMNHSKLLNVPAKQVQRGGHTQDAKSLQGTVW